MNISDLKLIIERNFIIRIPVLYQWTDYHLVCNNSIQKNEF